MSRQIRADYNQQFLLPPSLEDWVPTDHPARFIRDFVDALDLEALGFERSAGEQGRPSYASDLLLKVWLYGYFEKIRSSRALEKACYDMMGMIWLTGNQPPDHNTLWRFWRAHREALKGVFRQGVQVAVKADLVDLALQAVDGTKITAQVSTRKAWHRDTLRRDLKCLDAAIEEISAQVEAAEEREDGSSRLPEALAEAETRRARIKEALSELSARRRDHVHRNDPEATLMRCGERRQLAYNAQATTEAKHRIVVAEEVSDNASDAGGLVPMIESAEANTGSAAQETLADGGYYSGAELQRAEAEGYGVLVSLGTRITGEGAPYHKAAFEYDAARDVYVCPHGRSLTYERKRPSRRKTHEVRIYRCHHSRTCPHRQLCTRERRGRSIERAPFEGAVERQRARQDDPKHRALLARRKEIAELPFARVKHLMGFRRWTVRGLTNVRAQWTLLCTALNLRILYPHWRAGRLKLT